MLKAILKKRSLKNTFSVNVSSPVNMIFWGCFAFDSVHLGTFISVCIIDMLER